MFNFLLCQRNIPVVFLLFLLISGFTLTGCSSKQSTETENPQTENILPDAENSEVEITSPNINLANPLVISDKPEDVAMCGEHKRSD